MQPLENNVLTNDEGKALVDNAMQDPRYTIELLVDIINGNTELISDLSTRKLLLERALWQIEETLIFDEDDVRKIIKEFM